MTYKLRPYQHAALDETALWFKRNRTGNPLIVLPTGAGKAICIAELAKRCVEKSQDNRVLVLTHKRELVSQNEAELLALWPQASTGVYSAGLGRKETSGQVIFAGVQSLHKNPAVLGSFRLCLIDEAHLCSERDDSMYGEVLAALFELNPGMRVIGLTATAWRLSSGHLCGPGRLFSGISYEAKVLELMRDGYLCKLVGKHAKAQVDVSRVSVRNNEYALGELEAAFNKYDVVQAAIDEVIRLAGDRRSWIVFCSGVEHSKEVARELNRRGISAEVMLGETPSLFRDQHIADFKAGKLRALIGCEVLTTGVNLPCVDCIVLFRATLSGPLLVQMCGRGTRLSPGTGKVDCQVLDFGQNFLRHGPFDAIRPTEKKAVGTGMRAAPGKVCPNCMSVVAVGVRECPDCSWAFPPPSIRHAAEAGDDPVLSEPKWYTVREAIYTRHEKADKPPSLKAVYQIGDVWKVSDWWSLENPKWFPRNKAENSWKAAARKEHWDPPATVAAALETIQRGGLKKVKRVLVGREGKFDRVVEVEYESAEPTVAA